MLLDKKRSQRPSVHPALAEYMVYINLLERYQLKPWDVDAMDPDFVDVLLAKLTAENRLAERDRKSP